jgi:hypothetical protein
MEHDAQLTKGCSDGNIAPIRRAPAWVNELCEPPARMVEKRAPIVPLYGLRLRANPSRMPSKSSVPNTFTLSDDCDIRVTQLLRITQQYARVAQSAAAPRMQDALADLEDTLTDLIAGLEGARQDDWADAEYSGKAERERQGWQPLRVA